MIGCRYYAIHFWLSTIRCDTIYKKKIYKKIECLYNDKTIP